MAILLSEGETLASLLTARKLEVHGPRCISFGEQLAAVSAVVGKTLSPQYLAPDEWAKMLVSVGVSPIMAESTRWGCMVVTCLQHTKKQNKCMHTHCSDVIHPWTLLIRRCYPVMITVWQEASSSHVGCCHPTFMHMAPCIVSHVAVMLFVLRETTTIMAGVKQGPCPMTNEV